MENRANLVGFSQSIDTCGTSERTTAIFIVGVHRKMGEVWNICSEGYYFHMWKMYLSLLNFDDTLML
jgi:hypothetical protein